MLTVPRVDAVDCRIEQQVSAMVCVAAPLWVVQPQSCARVVFPLSLCDGAWCGTQASLSTAVLFAAYIAQQRFRPYVAAATLSSALQVGCSAKVALGCFAPHLRAGGGMKGG